MQEEQVEGVVEEDGEEEEKKLKLNITEANFAGNPFLRVKLHNCRFKMS